MKIGEIASKTGISEYTLRYYEKKGLIRVSRNENGIREYLNSDVEWIKFIKKLKETGMMLRDIKKYSDFRYDGDKTLEERLEMLIIHRENIIEEQKRINEYLKNIDDKINIYKSKINNI